MKKLFTLVLITSLLTVSALTPKRADAVLAGVAVIFTPVAVPIIIAGGIAVVGGAGWGVLSSFTNCGQSPACGINGLEIAVGTILAGLVILDRSPQGADAMKFAPVDARAAASLGLSDEEMTSYNSELDEINATSQEVGARVLASDSKTVDDALHVSNAAWSDLSSSLSASAFSALTKVSKSFVQSVQVSK